MPTPERHRLSRDADERAGERGQASRLPAAWGPQGRAVFFALVMLAVSAWAVYVGSAGPAPVPHRLPALLPLVAVGVWATARYPVSVGARRVSVAVPLCELPALVGVVFLPPVLAVLAFSAGYVPATWAGRRSWAQALANWACYLVPVSVAPVVYHLLADGESPRTGPGWLAGALAVVTMTLGELTLGSAMLALLHRRWRRLPGVAALVQATTRLAAGAGGGLIAVVLVSVYPWSAVLFFVVAVAAYAAYRTTVVAIRRYSNLHGIYESTRRITALGDAHEVMGAVLEDARRLMRAGRAELVMPFERPVEHLVSRGVIERDNGVRFTHGELMSQVDRLAQAAGPAMCPGSQDNAELTRVLDDAGIGDALIAPLERDGTRAGYLMVSDRPFGQEPFKLSDLRLFGALAANAGGALHSSDLVSKLRSEVSVRQYQSRHDTLTGLPNRLAVSERLQELLSEGGPGSVAVVLIDLEGFKDINDTLGHRTGDAVLREVAGRLLPFGTGRGTVARLGGDEFAVLLPDIAGRDQLRPACQVILDVIAGPCQIGEVRLDLRASLGVAVAAAQGRTRDAVNLMRHADVAMYVAKEAGGGVHFYDAAEDRSTLRRLTLATELRRALSSGGLSLWYQPVVQLGTGEVLGCEALLRWEHEQFGRISPLEFIPVAESAGLIDPLTWWVVDRALEQLRAWREMVPRLTVAVNLSARTLAGGEVPERVLGALARAGLPAEALTLELTESSMMTDPTSSERALRELRALGIGLSIDDYGTGFSSLSRLKQLPFKDLKIDCSFVKEMVHDKADEAIVRSTIELARSLGKTVIAEGVEDKATLHRLARLGCHAAQGYYLARPLPAPECELWLAAFMRWPSTVTNGQATGARASYGGAGRSMSGSAADA